MIEGLGGSLFVHDAVRLDYCVEAAIESLVPICREVVVLDCQSTDGTLDLVRAVAARHSSVEVVAGVEWQAAPDYHRLAILANKARERLNTRWHFMLQADEVLHEASYPKINQLLDNDGWGCAAFHVRRLNLWGDLDQHIRFDSALRPCSDEPVRIGRQWVPAGGDAESLAVVADRRMMDRVTLFHYGYVRRGPELITKAIEMQGWFGGPCAGPDPRVVAMRDSGIGFQPYALIPREELAPVPLAHPVAAESWVASHRGAA